MNDLRHLEYIEESTTEKNDMPQSHIHTAYNGHRATNGRRKKLKLNYINLFDFDVNMIELISIELCNGLQMLIICR